MHRTKSIFAALIAASAASGLLPARADAPVKPPSAQAFYVEALSAMRTLPQPAFVSYQMEGAGDGLRIPLVTTKHLVWLGIEGGTAPPTLWNLRHRTDDYASEIIDASTDRRLVTQRSFFDPTWFGSLRALRDGMLGYQDDEPSLSSRATPPPATPTTLKTIAVETVIGPGIYAVQDRGSAACANGDPGHALHVTPRSHDPRRQLTDVVVDLHSMRFCMIRYSWGTLGFRGIVEQHYADVGGYWMQTDGILDGTLRFFVFTTHHGIWRYRLTNMRFPSTLPPTAFIPDSTQ